MLRLSEQGEQAFGDGQYAKAAGFFEKANDKCSSLILAKNMTIAWYKADRCKDAIKFGSAYLLLGQWPSTPTDSAQQDYSDAKTILVRCNIKLAEAALAKEDLDEADERIKIAREQALGKQRDQYAFVLKGADKDKLDGVAASIKEKREELKKDNKVTPPPEVPKAEPPILAYALIGVGGVGVTVGAVKAILDVTGGNAALMREAQDEGCTSVPEWSSVECENKYGEAAIFQRNLPFYLSAGLGGAAIVTGVVLLLLPGDETKATEPNVRLLPSVGPNQAGVQLHWTF